MVLKEILVSLVPKDLKALQDLKVLQVIQDSQVQKEIQESQVILVPKV